ncbi:MAG: hypothetical protein K9N23_03485 [Akkermansiaceae bacterium]|nr:hypothetical protein [Akkermansiaceae bacterium]MCF7730719.1 hypothetical protein [Akkermansiaceae bacterium]
MKPARRGAGFRKAYGSQGGANMKRMVIVCHSMGGNLSDLQIRDSGDAMVKLLCDRPLDQLNVDRKAQDVLRRLLVFKSNPDIQRVAYLASPHCGSDMAAGSIGRLGARLIHLPVDLLYAGLAQGVVDRIVGFTETGRQQTSAKLDSVHSLRPDNPGFATTGMKIR